MKHFVSTRQLPASWRRAARTAAIAAAGVVGCGRDLAVDPDPSVKDPAFGAASPLAAISVGESGMNRVGSPHTVTGSVRVAADPGQPYLPVADGTRIDFAVTSGPGSLSAPSCTTAGGTGACSVTLNSTETGVTEVTASSTFTTAGTTLSVTTDFTGDNSGPVAKSWVDAKIAIEPGTGTNRIDEEHTFTVTVWKDFGDGNGFVAVDGQTVTAVQSGSLAPVALGGTCTTATTDGSGQCTFTATSSAPGTLTLSASSTVTFGGATSPVASSTLAGQDLIFTVTTSGSGNNSGPATKTWIDAKILIAHSNGTNRLGEEHTFTVTVLKDVGDGAGFVPAAGETVTATQSGNLAPLPLGGTCVSGSTDAAGRCTFTVTSNTPGTLTLTPSSTITVGGRAITVTTSGTATWVGAPTTGTQKPASISVDPAKYSTVAGSNTASGYFRIVNASGSGTVANITKVTLTLQRVIRGNKITMTDVTCAVTNIRTSSGRSRGPALPYTIEASPGFAFVDFTCTRSGGTFQKGWELKLLQVVVGNPAKKSSYHNTADFHVR